MREVPFIRAEDYSYEALRAATENWRYPAVVKGLFKGTTAVEKWADVDYLPSKIGHLVVPVHQNASLAVDSFHLKPQNFGDAFRTIHAGTEPKYMFFPVQSRKQFANSNYSTSDLKAQINKVVADDLELDRIYKGFGGPYHFSYFGSQLIVGHGTKFGSLEGQEKVHREHQNLTTGTGWHCALGNNWFVQVAGRKRWYFIDPKYSAYMGPAIGGEVNYQTILHDLSGVTPHLPVRFADIEPGDLIYNPDLEWHRIENYPGFSLGVPIREFHIERSFRNNALYTSFLIVDQILGKFGTNLGRPSCTDAKDCLRIWRQGYEAGAAYDETHNEL